MNERVVMITPAYELIGSAGFNLAMVIVILGVLLFSRLVLTRGRAT